MGKDHNAVSLRMVLTAIRRETALLIFLVEAVPAPSKESALHPTRYALIGACFYACLDGKGKSFHNHFQTHTGFVF